MRALSDMIFENKTLMFAAAAIALLVAVVLILLIFRLVFGRRLRMPGNGRARLPRLSIVDAFDLDRQRQLVIVRRDNVEHLIMIGGPNDLVIESEIIRAEARDGRIRDKEPREAAQGPGAAVAWPPEFDASRPPPPPGQPQRKMQLPPGFAPESDAEPRSAAFDEPIPAPAPAIVAPPPRPHVFPLPPRRAAPPIAPLPQRTPAQREPGANPSSVFPRAPLATPFLRPSPPRQLQEILKPGASAGAEGSSIQAPPASAPGAAPPPAVTEPPATPPEVSAGPSAESAIPSPAPAVVPVASEASSGAPKQDPIDSLEEEMAKLLGRGPGK